MKNKLFTLLVVLLIATYSTAQVVTGTLTNLNNQQIQLLEFNGFNNQIIAATTTNENGDFKLSYTSKNFGVGYLMSVDKKPLILILNGEDIHLTGQMISSTQTLKITKGNENQLFEKYAKEHPKREQVLSAWEYLEKMYALDSLFIAQKTPKQAIDEEKKRIKTEDATFLASLDNNSYLYWYLPMRKLVSNVSTVAQSRPMEIPATITAFRAIDYADNRLYKSGLLKDAVEGHFWLLENSGQSLGQVFVEMKTSIDAMMESLIKEEKILNEVTDYLFDLLERHSLFKASEYLALKVLNEISCTIDNDLAKQLETYRAMKKGNIAPDIIFQKDFSTPSYSNKTPKKLSDLKSKYTLVTFGASWCPKCKDEFPKIANLYPKWKAQEVEVVFISLDEEEVAFKDFVKNFPFISTCDYQKWEGSTVKDYYVFGTPTMFLLDEKREILLRPNSVNQVDAWVDWYLIKGNIQNK